MARNTASQGLLRHLFAAAVSDAESIFPNSLGGQWVDDSTAIYNANGVSGTWLPPTWYEDAGDLIAVSQPPIPIDTLCDAKSYWEVAGKLVRRGDYARLLPNHFGIHRTADSTVRIWSDVLGLGRCYYVITPDFVAASNHIGILAYFVDGPIEMDHSAVSRYAHTEWFTLNDSPIVGIRRLGEGSVIEAHPDGSARIYEHSDLRDLVGSRDQMPDYEAVVDQTRIVGANLDQLSVRTPTVMLSGGRDSRMTASIWLSSGNSARVVTTGTLQREAELASILMKDFFDTNGQDDRVSHEITYRKSTSITMRLEDRLERAFLMWDGDAAPINMRSNVPTPTGALALNIGGVGGEITHGYYYDHLDEYGSGILGRNPMLHAKRKFGTASVTEYSAQSMREYFEILWEKSVADGRKDILALDYLYLNEKYRRWGNQALNSTSAIMLSAPAFVRAAFDTNPSDHVSKKMPTSIVEKAIPSWANVPYYKASAEESKASMTKKLATFDTDPDYFFTTLHESETWPLYLQTDRVKKFIDFVRKGQAAPVHESFLNRAIWIDYIGKHVSALSEHVKQVHDLHRPSVTISENSYLQGQLDDLNKGFFAPRRSDDDASRDLVEGALTLGAQYVDVFDTHAFDDSLTLSRGDKLVLHSLRWVDVLRRSPVSGASRQAWSHIVNAWSRSEEARDRTSVAWAGSVLIQRSTALALGMGQSDQEIELADIHLQQLCKLGAEVLDGVRRLEILRVELSLMHRLGAPRRKVEELVEEAAMEVFHVSGYVSCSDLRAVFQAKAAWGDVLRGVGVDKASDAMTRVRATTFVPHLLSPTGRFIPFGEALPDFAELDLDAPTRYVISRGKEGSPPAALRSVIPVGPVMLHSGWGETERNVEDETATSILLGPVRGRKSHRDASRVTYSSQGRDWIIDPADSLLVDADCHSNILVDGRRYREHSRAELIREYDDGEVDGFVVNNTAYLPVQWRRHFVFVRTGNYVVVSDVLRSSDEFDAFQQWMVAPDVEVEMVRRGFVLRSQNRIVSISVVSRQVRDSVIEPILDEHGARLAWRIRVPMSGKSARATTVIADVTEETEAALAPRIDYFGAEFAVQMNHSNMNELLVVTPDRSVVFPGDSDPETSVSEAINRAASGQLSPEQALEQRLAVREAIIATKRQIREAGGTLESRKAGMEKLLETAQELNVHGLRDHGLGAAMVDVGGANLKELVSARTTSSGLRRTGLVNWGNSGFVQPDYKVPVVTSMSSDELPVAPNRPYIWSVDHGQLVPSSYITGCTGEVLTVYFHGATDRTRFTLPRYERLRSMGELDSGPLMFFSDPTLDLDSRMVLGWFTGTEELNLHFEIAKMISTVALHGGVKDVLLVGNSGGAFASLQVASYLAGSYVVAFNPQIQIDEYVPRIAQAAHWSCFGRDTVKDDNQNAERMDVIKRYRGIGFDQDVVLIQNPGDDQHYKDHFIPFVSAFEESGERKRLKAYTPDLGPGHRVPSVPEYMQYVRDALEEVKGQEKFGGLRQRP